MKMYICIFSLFEKSQFVLQIKRLMSSHIRTAFESIIIVFCFSLIVCEENIRHPIMKINSTLEQCFVVTSLFSTKKNFARENVIFFT